MRYKMSRLFKKAGAGLSRLSGGFRKEPADTKNSFRILLYHSIGKLDKHDPIGIRLDRGLFFRQMKYLYDNHYNVAHLRDLVELLKQKKSIPEKSIAITFDDGYRDNLIEAAPILKEFSFPATIFICADYLGLSIRESGYCDIQGDFLKESDLKELLNLNLDIGAHSSSHKHLTKLPYDKIETEVIFSKEKIRKVFNRDAWIFSYPYGDFNEVVVGILRKIGFTAACCSIPGRNDYKTGVYELRRTEILRDDSLSDFINKINGYYDWANCLRQWKAMFKIK